MHFLRQDRPNLSHVTIDGGPVMYFSYEECIAFSINPNVSSRDGRNFIVHENVWSNTTGRHLDHVDSGDKEHRKLRVMKDQFKFLYNLHWEGGKGGDNG